MKVLVGCEESQTVALAFRKRGHEAYSCDIKETRGNPDWHFKDDVVKIIPIKNWDLIILHPECTAMAVSGNRWYGEGMPMHDKRVKAINWTLKLWELAKQYGKKVALENPVSVVFKYLPNVFYIQPWQFGHGETKATCLWLKNLPLLTPTNIVEGRESKNT